MEELRQALLNDNWTPFNMDTIRMMLRLFDRNANGILLLAIFAVDFFWHHGFIRA